jgi:hypothetical protein
MAEAVPLGQGVHAVAPAVGLYVPAAHDRHPVALLVLVPYRPGLQATHVLAPLAAYLPNAHDSHVLAPAPAKVPGRHTEHCVVHG